MDATSFDISDRLDARVSRVAMDADWSQAAQRGAFASRLGEASESESEKQTAREEEIREASEQLVASAFILPLLSQLRETGFASERFKPSSGEKLFQQRMDTMLADRMAASPGFPMVDALVEHMTQRAARRGYGNAANPNVAATRANTPSQGSVEIDRHG